MEFKEIVTAFGAAVEAGDGTALANLFTEDGVYHDMFYGAFKGREAIKGMLEEIFHRDATDFRWEILDPVTNGRIGYAHWLFSYTGKTEHIKGRRVIGNGFLFSDFNSRSFYDAMERCAYFFRTADEVQIYRARANAKKSGYYWESSATRYIDELYGINEIIRRD